MEKVDIIGMLEFTEVQLASSSHDPDEEISPLVDPPNADGRGSDLEREEINEHFSEGEPDVDGSTKCDR